MKFTKMQGCGNDYVYVNGFVEKIAADQKPELVKWLSNRNYGIGSDGVIFINPSDQAHFEMEMFNADGTGSGMCGNGIRCVAKYVYDNKMTARESISIISGGSVKYLNLTVQNEEVSAVEVNMGKPELRAELVPVKSELEESIDEEIEAGGRKYRMTCISMGNPHAVVFVEDLDSLPIEEIGPYFEQHERFPERVNTEFIKIEDRTSISMRVWERGTGETLACGTGACAAAVASMLNGHTENQVTVHLLGGDLKIRIDQTDGCVYMTGPAVTVFEGEIDLNKIVYQNVNDN